MMWTSSQPVSRAGDALALALLSIGLAAAAPVSAETIVVAAAPTASSSAACGADTGAELRSLPVLSTGQGGTLALAISATRSTGPVMIGDLPVHDVPVFALSPDAGTRLRIPDAAGHADIDMPVRCLSSPSSLYAGTIWALHQGDVLQIRLTSGLDFQRGKLPVPVAGGMSCRGANLHTHGLLVSPARSSGKDGEDDVGDSAFDVAVPARDAGFNTDVCADDRHQSMGMESDTLHRMVSGVLTYWTAIPGTAGISGRDDGEHPSGLFWYHPHVHGYDAPFTGGGMSGVITVGDLADYVCMQQATGCITPEAIMLRTMVLRDAEIMPDGGGWRLSHDRIYPLEDACALSRGRDEDRQGQCVDWKARRWLFTINGQRFPSISTIDPARVEVWRIVNASPNMTYLLRLRRVEDPTGSAPLPLKLLSLEGAAPAPAATTMPGEVRELLLMPAARAEIAISAPAKGGAYVLEQEQFTTGGDTWPRIMLAQVKFPVRTVADPAGGLRLRRQGAGRQIMSRFLATGGEPACEYAPDAIRRIFLVERPSFTDDRRRPIKFGLIADVERRNMAPLIFDQSGQPRAMNRPAWEDLLKQDANAPAFAHNPFGTICTYIGHSETWIIDNYTNEAHNFHIHQSEFRLALEHRHDPAFFSVTAQNGVGRLQRASDAVLAAADGEGRDDIEAMLYHDTIPIPRGIGLGGRGCDGSPLNDRCRPGRIALVVRFDRDSQVGTFVYHCHILQHEDEGMMAVVKVLCPPGDVGCAQRHSTPGLRTGGHRMD